MAVDWTDVRVPLTRAVEEEISEIAGLPGLTGWQDLGGNWSTNIAARQHGQPRVLVFRIHQRFVSKDRLLAEQHTRRVLGSAGLPSVGSLPIFQGSTIARLRSGNLIEVEPFISSDAKMDSPERLIAGFATLGALHDALRSVSLTAAAHAVTYANHLDAHLVDGRTRAGVDKIKSWRIPELATFVDRLPAHITSVLDREADLRFDQHVQVVHGDFWDNNVLFVNGEVAAVLDFGFMASRPRIDDLALPIWFYLLGRAPSDPAAIDVVTAMVDAYDQTTSRPLTTAERLSLPLVLARQPAWMIGRWVLLDENEARAQAHARRAATEFSVAVDVLDRMQDWQQALRRTKASKS